MIKVDKLNAAKSQLRTAVKLYFYEEDPISIHTIVGAAHELLSNVGEKKGFLPMTLSYNSIVVKDEYRKEFVRIIKKAINFFKYAIKDTDKVLEFPPEINEYFLIDACEMYMKITDEVVPEFLIMRGWFHYIHPDILKSIGGKIIENTVSKDKRTFYNTMMSGADEFMSTI
jgi:hypothetical protein